MKAIIILIMFAVGRSFFRSITHYLLVGWFTVTTKLMENVLATAPDGADRAIFWGRILGFASHPMLWIFILAVNYGNG